MLSNCSGGSAEVMEGFVVTVETDSYPSPSEFHWEVNGDSVSTSESITLGPEVAGQQVDVFCLFYNVMMGDARGNDTASCVYSVQGLLVFLQFFRH